ncbi:MAG: T9SS type A sorting domain-containing protein [Flavobacteriales bacterium]|nr:T9SS type A sorting domain-containing protein [Flavobacteriales bacterium]MCB9447893.1 T9SS type A sorting domain-containing protein [Flavobacteriales bacterium]
MKQCYLTVAACLFAFIGNAANDGPRDQSRSMDVRYVRAQQHQPNEAIQANLRQADVWQSFLQKHGAWYVVYDENNQMPHRAFGQPIPVPVPGDPREKAMYFIQHELQGFHIPVADLEFLEFHSSGKYHYVNFRQRYKGLPVRNSRLTLKMTLDGRVVMFGLDVFNHISMPVVPSVSKDASISSATEGIQRSIESTEVSPDLEILPVPGDGSYSFHLVYNTTVHARNEDDASVPAIYDVLVDANTGKLLSRKDRVRQYAHMNDKGDNTPSPYSTVTVQGEVSVTSPHDAAQMLPMPYVEIGGVNADVNGVATLPSDPASATVNLKGPYAVVYVGASGTTGYSYNATGLTTGSNTVDLTSNIITEAISGYYHTNIIHDYMRTKFTSFTDMDTQLPVRVQRTDGNCNAFYDGASINFYVTGNNCYALSMLGDVVYHEYGHGINDNYYQSKGSFFANGAMNEGYADVWAIGVTELPYIGKGTYQDDAAALFRCYAPECEPKVYPKDLIGEVHADGEIIAGAWYDVALNFGSVQDMMDLFSATFNGLATGPDGTEGDVYTEILIDALQEDDDNGDITDGTPRALDIVNAFARHGITLLSNATLLHTDLTSATPATPITITADITFTYAWAFQNAYCWYTVNESSTLKSVALTNSGGSTYTGQIPAQPDGSLVRYYVGLEDIYNKIAAVQPVGADKAVFPNIPYFVTVGFTKQQYEDFDDFSGNWVVGASDDNATTGLWTIDIPIPSYADLDGDGNPDVGDPDALVQVDDDYTPASGAIACAFTGNANSSSDAIGTNDVDGGKTSIISPVWDLTGMTNPLFTWRRWYVNGPVGGANPGNDWWQAFISTDDGNTWTKIEETNAQDRSWRRFAFRVRDYVTPSAQVKLKFVASDSLHPNQGLNLDGGSIVEAALDDIELWEAGNYPLGKEEQELIRYKVFPNPATTEVGVDFELQRPEPVRVTLMNNLGQEVYSHDFGSMSTGAHHVTVPTDDLAPGMYMLLFEAGNIRKGEKVTLMK